MARSAILAVRIVGDADGAKRAFAETQTAADKFKSGLDRITPAATAAFAGVAAASVKAIQAASTLQQSMGAVESVFGSASSEIERFGKGAAESLGLSQRAFNELASVSGAMLQNLGYNSSEAAKATEELAQRAADLASVFGGTTADAMDAMNAALRGEYDQLERYGVKLSQTAVTQKALEMGLDTSTVAAQNHANAQAALALIMEQSAGAAGNFAAESDTLAGSTETLKAKFEDVAAQLGQALLPLAEQFVGWLTQLADWIDRNQQLLSVLIPVIGGLAAAIMTVQAAVKAWETAQLLLNVALTANPIGLVVAAIGALVSALVYAYQHSETFREAVNRLFSALGNILGKIGEVASAIGGFFVDAWNAAKDAIGWVVDKIKQFIDWAGRAIAKAREFTRALNPLNHITLPWENSGSSRSAAPDGRSLRSASGGGATRATTGSGSTVYVSNMAYNPHTTAHDLQRILTGAQVRTGYAGVRL